MPGIPKGQAPQTAEQVKAKKKLWYVKNRERVLAHYKTKRLDRNKASKRWALKHPEKSKARYKKFHKSSKGKAAAEHSSFLRRFREHGLTLDQYHAMIEVQDFQCAICTEVPEKTYGGSHDGFHIDHHHVTKRVRGLLCDTCNVGIGMLKDSAEVCTKASAYLSCQPS